MTMRRSSRHSFVTLERLDRQGPTITVVLRVADPSTLVAADLLATNAIIPSLAEQVTGGAEQYFARAVDFGFSFSRDETFERWHRDEILEDVVYWVRRVRPDVIVGFVWDHTEGGGQHHQASTAITADAFRLAADPSRFPDQIAAGLRPWQASRFYYTGGFGGDDKLPAGRVCRVDGNQFDPLLGRTRDDRDWHPQDGRITDLGLHMAVDPSLGHDVLVSIAAAPAAARTESPA